MSQPVVPHIGAVISADIAVPEHEQEVRFYSRVLTTGDDPLWREDLMNNLDMPVIGLGERNEEYAHLPLQWMPHIQVADVAASVQRSLELGGSELMHYKDEEGISQWAVLLDPNEAAFGIIPTVPADAVPSVDVSTTGSIRWLDLTVPDAAATRDFYQQVVGWSVDSVKMNDGENQYDDYIMLGGDGNAVAGICHARGVNLEIPPVWMLYLPVRDFTESLRRVEEEGGKVIMSMDAEESEHVFAIVQDPVGVYFALMPG